MNERNLLRSGFFVLLITISLISFAFGKDKATTWFEKGVKAVNRQEKLLCFKKAIEYDPLFIEAHYNLGCVYRDMGEFNKAEKSFNRALSVCPDDIDDAVKLKIIFELGKAYKKLEKYDYAKETFLYAKSLAQNKEIKSAIILEIVNLFIVLQEYDKALSYINEGINLSPTNKLTYQNLKEQLTREKQLQSFYDEGVSAFQQGEFHKAIDYFSRIIDINPNYKDVDEKLSQAKLKVSELSESEFIDSNNVESSEAENFHDTLVINETTTIQPDSESYNVISSIPGTTNNELEQLFQKGLKALENERWVEALYIFNRIKQIDPNFKDVNSRIIEARLGMESIKEMEEVTKCYNKGLQEFNNGDLVEAIISFEKAKLLYPGYKDIELRIIEAKRQLAEQKQVNGDNINTIAQLKPNEADNEKSNFKIMGMLFSALIPLTTLLFLLSPSVQARYYLLQGKYERASQLYESLLAKHPHNAKFYVTLANIYLLTNRRDEKALEIYQLALHSIMDLAIKKRILALLTDSYLKEKNANKQSVNILASALEEEIKNLGKT